MSLYIPTEEWEQQQFVKWLKENGYAHFRVPNETFTRSWKQKNKNKSLGVSAGVPDLFIIVGDQLIAIEMKRVKGSVTSQAQKEWLDRLSAAHIPSRICKGSEQAIKFVREIGAHVESGEF